MPTALALVSSSEDLPSLHLSEKDTLEAYSIFLKDLKLLLEHDFALQEHYKAPKMKSSSDARDGFLVIMETLSKVQQTLSHYVARYSPARLLPEKISLRVQKIGQSGGDPRIDVEYEKMDHLQKEIENFKVYGFGIDVIRLFIPHGKKVNKRNAKALANTVFRKMKPILLQKEV